MFFSRRPMTIPPASECLPGRDQAVAVAPKNIVTQNPMVGPFGDQLEVILVGMGCFWGAERLFYSLPGVWTTAVGYAAGHTPNPTYEEVCTGLTGHNEVVLIVFDPSVLSNEALIAHFWENHDPTQGMRQGMDRGTQYRSGLYVTTPSQRAEALESKARYEARLASAGFGPITTEILDAPTLYYAEDYHQQYLHKNPSGYCGIGGTGISCPIGLNPEG
uniref:Peptide methionine sulfoxide reductase MsrA n=2 Tax=environmental samples TaxID=48479 RepID=C7FPH2_9BACT|nr:peptide methionine sulfoxide reductase [uncultured bacterium HF186_25m_30B18]ACU26475.1 peptide methionine sulfoxide reductase [uncultured bacterium HF186_25m_13D19]